MYSHITNIKRFLAIVGSLFVLMTGCTPTPKPIKVAMIADCQYCDCDYNSRWNNDYRKGKTRLISAIDTLNEIGMDLGFHLGDFIDRDFNSFDTLLPIINSADFKFHHVLGNHDFKVADTNKHQVLPTLQLEKGYYSIEKDAYRFIVLDGTEVSNYRYTDSTKINHANTVMNAYASEHRPQAKPWNGGISNTQLRWLKNELESCTRAQQNAIVVCHFPVSPLGDANLWNDQEVVALLTQYKAVKLFINGHHHAGNFTVTQNLPFVTMHAMVTTTNTSAFGYLKLYPNKIELVGYGREPSREFTW